MDIEKSAFKLIERIYDATLAPEKWQQVMTDVIDTTGAKSALLREVNYTQGKVGLYKTQGFDPAFTKAYSEHFVRLDYFAPKIMSNPIGEWKHGDQAVPWQKQRNTEFCNDFLLRQGNRFCLGVSLTNTTDNNLLFALQRSTGQGDFTELELMLLRLIAPHMVRAINIHLQLQTVTFQRQWYLSALDRLALGVILLSEKGKLLFANNAAENFLSANYGLACYGSNLTFTNSLDATRLQQLVANAARAAQGQLYLAGGHMQTASGLSLQVIPLPRDKSECPWGVELAGSCVAVFVSVIGKAQLSAASLCERYGLTNAEAKLASLLADGLSLEQAADRLSVSIQTVRSQLKAIFSKTQVTRQAELVARLLTDMLVHQLIK